MKCYKKDYPRPQFVRDNWENLNGLWGFAFDDDNKGEKEKWYFDFPETLMINVPFTYETKMSGIGDERRHDNIWYRRIIEVDSKLLEENHLILHLEGSDFQTMIWINGQYAGKHKGGYTRFSFDITDLVEEGKNELVIKVEDSFDPQQPRGKQRWVKESFECWYVQTTGIWKTVWMEYVPAIHLDRVKMTPNLRKEILELEYELVVPESALEENVEVEAIVYFENHMISRTITSITAKHMTADVNVRYYSEQGMEWGIRTWSPESPDLYDITFRVIKNGKTVDIVDSYFAMREIRIDGPNILLNGKPLYQRLILDQGYWKDSHLTPPSEEALIQDIDKIHRLGYNGLRKHQKTEDERFLYWCDVKGMLVWGEMASAFQYSDYAVEQFAKEWIDVVKQSYNHPCIITWVPVNESWGVKQIETDQMQQHFTEMLYHLTKSMDQCRPVIVNDGWEHTVSDIITFHDYEEAGEILYQRYTLCKEKIFSTEVYHSSHKSAFAHGFSYKGQPVIISEFGGIAFTGDDYGWGYGNKVCSKEEFIHRFDEITTAVKKIPYCCGFCYTQLTDVQQEVNGLMNIEREFKIDPEVISEINKRKIGYWRSFM